MRKHQFKAALLTPVLLFSSTVSAFSAQQAAPIAKLTFQVCPGQKGLAISESKAAVLTYTDPDGSSKQLELTRQSGPGGQTILSGPNGIKATITPAQGENNGSLGGWIKIEVPGKQPSNMPFTVTPGKADSKGICPMTSKVLEEQCKAKDGSAVYKETDANGNKTLIAKRNMGDGKSQEVFRATLGADGNPTEVNTPTEKWKLVDPKTNTWQKGTEKWTGTVRYDKATCQLAWENCYAYYWLPNGSKVTESPDGSKETTDPKGNKSWTDPDGREIRRKDADGSNDVIIRRDPNTGEQKELKNDVPGWNYNPGIDPQVDQTRAASVAAGLLAKYAKPSTTGGPAELDYESHCQMLQALAKDTTLTEKEKLLALSLIGKAEQGERFETLIGGLRKPVIGRFLEKTPPYAFRHTCELPGLHQHSLKGDVLRHQILTSPLTLDGYHGEAGFNSPAPDTAAWNAAVQKVIDHEATGTKGLSKRILYNFLYIFKSIALDIIGDLDITAAGKPLKHLEDLIATRVDFYDGICSLFQIKAMFEYRKRGMAGYADEWCRLFVDPACRQKTAQAEEAARQAACKAAKERRARQRAAGQ